MDPTTESEELAYTPEALLEWPRDQLEQLNPVRIAATSPLTVAQFLERLEVDECRDVLRQLSSDRASDILSEMDEEYAAEVIAAMRDTRAVQILDDFEPDDAADIVAEFDEDARNRLLPKMEAESRESIVHLLQYDPESAGGIMTTEVDTAFEDMTVREAEERIREFADRYEDLHYVYVTDRQERLVGIVSLRKLIQAKPGDRLEKIMTRDIRGVCQPEMDKEEVALLMAEYNLSDIAVVDAEGHLLGVITHDDVLDVIQDEATEDIQKLTGAGGDESVNDEVVFSIRRRQPWLGFNLLTAFFATAVVLLFDDQIAQLPVLAGLMPIIAGVGGNSGQQSLAVVLRSIALGELHTGERRAVLFKQMAIGLINGLCIGLLAGVIVLVVMDDLKLAAVVLTAMIMNMALAGLAGAFIPIILKHFNRDPAQSSSIFLTAITDTGGFFIFLSLGAWLLL